MVLEEHRTLKMMKVTEKNKVIVSFSYLLNLVIFIRLTSPLTLPETLLERVRESRTGWIYCEPMHVTMCLRVAEKIYWDVEVIVTSKEPVEGCTSIYELMEDDGCGE